MKDESPDTLKREAAGFQPARSVTERGRGQRRARTESIQAQRVREWNVTQSWPMTEWRRGRARNMHPIACGKARCGICHGEKLDDIPLSRDLRNGVRENKLTRERILAELD